MTNERARWVFGSVMGMALWIGSVSGAQAQDHGRVSALDGVWNLSFECGPHGAPGSKVDFKGGHIEGAVDARQDVLVVDAYVGDDGKIEGFFNGNLVGGPLTGTVSNWPQGRVAGEMVLRGEIVCYGTWQAQKAN